MDFNQLYKKIASFDKPVNETADNWKDKPDNWENELDEPEQIDDLSIDKGEDEEDVEFDECGMIIPNKSVQATQPSQPDSVSVSLNMNGSGAGGIRDLLDVLKGFEQNTDDDNKNKLFGQDSDVIDEKQGKVYPVDRVLQTGNDLHGQGGPEPRKAAGGGNPYVQYNEALVDKLTNLYREVKNR